MLCDDYDVTMMMTMAPMMKAVASSCIKEVTKDLFGICKVH